MGQIFILILQYDTNPKQIDLEKASSFEGLVQQAKTLYTHLQDMIETELRTTLELDVPEFFQVPKKYEQASFEEINKPSKTQKRIDKLLDD